MNPIVISQTTTDSAPMAARRTAMTSLARSRPAQKVASENIDGFEDVRQDNRVADHHFVTVTKHDGTVSRIEAYLFSKLAEDGRPRRVDEVSRVVSGTTEDADLVRVR
jgi:hypothetical protein